MQNKNQEQDKNLTKNLNKDLDKDISGSTITDPEEKQNRKYDDWKAHTHEKHREPTEEYRASELHGVVGKEIEVALQNEKDMQKDSKNQKNEK
jgi:hypothetical protein